MARPVLLAYSIGQERLLIKGRQVARKEHQRPCYRFNVAQAYLAEINGVETN
jgi:hypothetical protein